MALRAREFAIKMAMEGMDKVVSAADPMNILQRRVAVMNAEFQQKEMPFKLQQLEYETKMQKMKADWYSDPKNAGKPFPYPTTFSEANQALTFNQRTRDLEKASHYTTDPTSATSVPDSKKVPPVETKTVVPTTPMRNIFAPPGTKTPEQIESESKFGPLPGFSSDNTGAAVPSWEAQYLEPATGAGTGASAVAPATGAGSTDTGASTGAADTYSDTGVSGI
jgi:hypothetical protein